MKFRMFTLNRTAALTQKTDMELHKCSLTFCYFLGLLCDGFAINKHWSNKSYF